MKLSHLLLVLLFTSYVSFGQAPAAKEQISSIPVHRSAEPVYVPFHFFPMHKWKEEDGILKEEVLTGQFDTSAVKSYSHVLARANEPVLHKTRSKAIIFRLVVIRAFEGPIVIRLEKRGRNYRIISKVLDIETKYHPPSMERTNGNLTKEKWDEFVKLIESSEFSKKVYSRRFIPEEDGSDWLVERVDSGGYCAASMDSPGKNALHEACLFLLNLAGISAN